MSSDDFETGSGSASDTAGTKYYQITVPSFQEVSAPSGAYVPTTLADGTTSIPTYTGSSFLRIGSSPASTDWTGTTYKASVNLARLAGDPALIAKSQGISVVSGAISSSNEENANASTLGSGSGWSSGFEDGAGVSGPYGYAGDPNYLLGFADDTRYHGASGSESPAKTLVNGVAVANDHRNRQAETLRLLTKGGWWDHSGGNRISTTAGDKIEVIQGNYKMVVLGRQSAPTTPTTVVDIGYCTAQSSTLAGLLSTWYADQSTANSTAIDTAWSAVSADARGTITADQIRTQYAYNMDTSSVVANGFITDVSGGHFQEQYPSPTPCIKTVEYLLDDTTGEWTLYQDNGLGNVVTKLKGRTVDLFQGTKREAYVGSESTDDAGLDPTIISKTWATSSYSQLGSEDKPVGWSGDGFSTSTAKAMEVDFGGDGSTLAGDVVAKTWAQRIRTYVGSVTRAVPHIYTETYADEIQTYTFAASHVTTTMGASSVSVNGVLNTLEIVVGLKESFQLAATLSVGVTETRIRGNNNSVDLSRNTVAAQEAKMAAMRTAIDAFESNICNATMGIRQTNVELANASLKLGAAVSVLAGSTLIA